ncbi:hypothetical protein CspHIS471_0100380 [Cutaneotrichosporon sp. HIS471]|nr:hypothetical protein CspHIS471_0100380 [Cutaneotrichosporon sp. HIS471]
MAQQQDDYQLQRSRNGCLTCRSRRVKCDEVRPVCTRCKTGDRDCEWGPEKPPNPRKRRRPVHVPVSRQQTASGSDASPQVSVTTPNTAKGTVTLPPSPSVGPVDTGIEWISHTTRKKLMMDPTMLETFFHKSDEVLTFRHYIQTAEELIAFNPPKNPFNPWVSIHAPLALRNAPGISPSSDALRIALLAVGAVRLRYADDPSNQQAAQRIAGDARRKALKLLDPILREPEKYMNEIESTLAAMLSCIVACTLAADNTWEDTLVMAVRLIDRLGGAQMVVSLSLKDQYSVTRFVLEQLAVRDVVACMTLGRRPSIIRQPFEPWFFEIERWSHREVEWESVERLFGVTRGMVDVMARACSLIGTARETQALQSVGGLRAPPPQLQDAANGILGELQVLDQGFNYSPYHTRAQYGNHCYRHAMQIALMRDVLDFDAKNERVVSSATAILELVRELDFEEGPTLNWLLWPLMLAGFHLGHEGREPLIRLLEHPGPQKCFDTRACIRLIKEFWDRQDRGVPVSHWEMLRADAHRCLFAG